MKKNRIEISAMHKDLLSKEFKVSRPTVQMSLDYYNNSETAVKIRERAIELLKEQLTEAEKLKS
jgi:hypothetical protein